MLIASINPEKADVVTHIGDVRGQESLDDTKVHEIFDAMLVESYKQFEEKFAPTVYQFWDSSSQSAQYRRVRPDIPENLVSEIRLGSRHPTTGVLFSMLDSHTSSGATSVNFDYGKILDQINPKKTRDAIQQVRKELMFHYQRFAQLPPGDPVRDEHAVALNTLMEETRAYYKNPTQMLALMLDDSERRLLLSSTEQEEGARNEQVVAGLMKISDDGSLSILAAPKPEEHALALTEGEHSTALAAVLEQDYEASTKEEERSDFVKDLVKRTFSPLAVQTQTALDLEQEAAKYNTYLELYTSSQAAFLECAKPIAQIMLGVYSYFQQYPVKGKGGMPPKLLVTNCDPEMLARSGNISRLEVFLASTNDKNDYEKTIWLAMIPNLSMKRNEDVNVTKEVFETVNKVRKNTDVVSMETLSVLLNTLAEYQVKTFFSFETGEETTFDKVQREGISSFVDRVENLMDQECSAFAVPCLPNITVIPKNKSGVITGTKMDSDGTTIGLSQNKEDVMRFWVNGIYLPACFPAAGLYAAMQCPEALRHWFSKNADPELPGVRVDLEAGNNSNIILPKLARENSGFSKSVKQEINRQRFGFIFSSEYVVYQGKKISRITVYTARSLASDGLQFESIFQSSVTTFFERILAQITGDNKDQSVKFFFSNNPKSQMSQWKAKKNMVNAIIQEGDEVEFELDETGTSCDINFTFGGVTKNVRVKLNRATARAV